MEGSKIRINKDITRKKNEAGTGNGGTQQKHQLFRGLTKEDAPVEARLGHLARICLKVYKWAGGWQYSSGLEHLQITRRRQWGREGEGKKEEEKERGSFALYLRQNLTQNRPVS